MKFKKPNFWDLKKPSFISNILFPLTIFTTLNNFLTSIKNKKDYKKIKTICVGNIYVGGTGKTPSSIKLYNMLKAIKSEICVGKKFYTSQKDEQIILEKKTNLVLGSSRDEIINKAIQANKELLIFDDGLQDKDINYDLKIVCFDAKKWIGNGRLLPAGPLRESLESIKKYDFVFIKNRDDETEEIINLIKFINPKIEIFLINYKPLNLNNLSQNDKYLIFSGIGNPESFKDVLEKNNLKIVKEIIFPDHYEYKKKDIEKIELLANSLNAKILTTEKDFVKLEKFNFENINFLEMDLHITDEKKLLKLIKTKLNE